MRTHMTSPAAPTPPAAPAAPGARLLLRAAGQYVARDGEPVDLEPKDALLLAYLAVEGPTPRGRVAAFLWPDADEERARGNLRQRLLRLKRATGIELVVGGPRAELASGVTHDLEGAHELLQGVDEQQAGGLADWLEAQRDKRRRAHMEALAAAAAQAEAAGDLGAAIEHANALVDLDPLSEHAHRRVMKLHYLRGDAAAAMSAYERCRAILSRDLKTTPSKETEALRAGVDAAMVPPEHTHIVRAVPVSVLRPPRLVGRDVEWEALRQAWGEARTVFVLGEAGMGKTRLLTDFARSCTNALVARARPGDDRVVYSVVSRLLRQFEREHLAALEVGIRRELARLLPELGDAEPIRSEAERARFFNAVAAALQAQRPHLAGLIVDDLHFVDEASIELIQYLEGACGLRWVFAARQAELGEATHALVDSMRDKAQVVELRPLDEAQIGLLVASLDLPGVDGSALAPLLYRRTGGNPLFVLETLKAWLVQGGENGGTRLPAITHVGALIERRIGRLSPEAIRLARCAAVAGQDFSVELSAHVLGVRPLDLADAWSELESAQVFRDSAFLHDLIHEAALASVPPPIARELHGQIARYLTERDAPPGRLAEHWLAAGQQREALAALVHAATSARHQTLRLAEAARLYERAAEVAGGLDDHDAAFKALHALADTWISLDRNRLGTVLVDRLDTHATTPHQQAQASAMRGQVLLHRGRYAEAIAVSQRAAELARAAGDQELVASSLSDGAAAASQIGDAERAVRMLRPLLPWTLEHGSDETRINVLGHLGICLDNIDHQAEAQAIHQRAVEAAMRARRFDQAVSAWGNLAISLIDVGKPRAALEAIAQARSVSAAYDALEGNSFSLNLFEGVASMELRKYRAALAAIENAYADVAHNALAAVAVRVHRACLWIHLGQYARAQRELAIPALLDPPPTWLDARRQQMLGRCAWWMGRESDAADHWRAAAACAPKTERAVLGAMIALDQAQTLPAGQALTAARGVLARAERLGHFGSALAARIRLARLAMEQGDMDTAVQALSEQAQTTDDIEPNDLYAGERWLASVLVLRAAGRNEEAARTLAEAAGAIRGIARDHVPEEFRDSFLNRNPVNRELLTLATRLR